MTALPPTPALTKLRSQSAAVPMIFKIPLLVAVLSMAQDYITAHKVLAKTEHHVVLLSEWVTANFLLRLSFLAGAILLADSLTAKILDKAQEKAPVVFTTTVGDVQKAVHARYADVRNFAFETGTKAQSQFGLLKSEHTTLQRTYDSLISLNTQLVEAGNKAKNAGTSMSITVQTEVDKTIVKVNDELERLHHYLVSLPADARARLEPVQQTFLLKYEGVKRQLKDRNAPLATRAAALTSYLTNTALPALNKALQSVPFAKPASKSTTADEVTAKSEVKA